MIVSPYQGIVIIVRNVLVEFLVLVVGNILCGTGPESLGLVDLLPLGVFGSLGFLLVLVLVLVLGVILLVVVLLFGLDGFQHFHRNGNVIGVLGYGGTQSPVLQIFGILFLQGKNNVSAAVSLGHSADSVFAGAVGLPAYCLIRGGFGGTADNSYLVGNDKGGVEAYAKLTDELGIPGLIAGKILEKLGGAGLGDGAQVLADLITGHADTVIGDGQGLLVLVSGKTDVQIGIIAIN